MKFYFAVSSLKKYFIEQPILINWKYGGRRSHPKFCKFYQNARKLQILSNSFSKVMATVRSPIQKIYFKIRFRQIILGAFNSLQIDRNSLFAWAVRTHINRTQ